MRDIKERRDKEKKRKGESSICTDARANIQSNLKYGSHYLQLLCRQICIMSAEIIRSTMLEMVKRTACLLYAWCVRNVEFQIRIVIEVVRDTFKWFWFLHLQSLVYDPHIIAIWILFVSFNGCLENSSCDAIFFLLSLIFLFFFFFFILIWRIVVFFVCSHCSTDARCVFLFFLTSFVLSISFRRFMFFISDLCLAS